MRSLSPRALSPRALLAGLLLASLSSAQDQPGLGYQRAELPYPGGTPFALTASTGDGRLVVFDGFSLSVYDDAAGVRIDVLAEFPAFVFPSFVRIDPDGEYVYVAESTNQTIQRALLTGSGTIAPFATLANAYDASFRDAGTLYVSAASCGFGCGNEIWRFDTTTGAGTLFARADGASGPLAFGTDGYLYYGTATAQFPPPPKPSQVVRFSPAQLDGPPGLSALDAELVGGGFAGASQFAVDPQTGALFLGLNNFGTGENRIQRVLGSADESPVILEGRPFLSLANLDFVPSAGPARFLPHQPPEGGALRYTTTDFGALVERHAVSPHRPQLTFSGPGTSGPGPFVITLDSGPALGLARIFFCPVELVPPIETVLVRAGVPLFLGLHLPTAERFPGLWAFDADGHLELGLNNPGGLEGLAAVQLLLFDHTFHLAGTSTTAAF